MYFETNVTTERYPGRLGSSLRGSRNAEVDAERERFVDHQEMDTGKRTKLQHCIGQPGRNQ